MRWLLSDTKEVREESHISVAQLLLEKMIKAQNFRGGLEVIGRINMEVGRLMEERHEIQTLLNRHVTEGLAALENYHDRLMKWFSEEQRPFCLEYGTVCKGCAENGDGQDHR